MSNLRYPLGPFSAPLAFDPIATRALLPYIAALPRWLDVLVENIDAAQLHTPYRPGGWTVAQTIHHLADSHLNAYLRTKLAITEAAPRITPYDQDLWAQTAEVEAVPVNVSITLLHALHRRWAALLESLDDAQWTRGFFHPEQNRVVPLWELAAHYAWHGRHHTEQVRALRERMGWN